jgi:hypothetical protein
MSVVLTAYLAAVHIGESGVPNPIEAGLGLLICLVNTTGAEAFHCGLERLSTMTVSSTVIMGTCGKGSVTPSHAMAHKYHRPEVGLSMSKKIFTVLVH